MQVRIEEKPPMGPRGLWVLALIIIVLWGAVEARPFLIPVSIAALLAFLLAPLVRVLTRRKVPEAIAIGISVLLLVLPFAGGVYLLVRQGQSLVEDFPSIVTWFNRSVSDLSHNETAVRFGLNKYLNTSAITERLTQSAGQGVQLVLGGLKAFLDIGSQTVLILIFSIAMLGSRKHLRVAGEKILAQFENLQAAKMLDVVTGLVERFLVARLAIVLFIAVVSTIILLLFGVKYCLLLGAFIGVMTLVPAIGFVIGIAATLIVALATGQTILTAVFILLALIGLNIVEGNILTPLLVGKHLNVNALFTFLGFFAGGLLWGVWGMFLSVPILGVVRIALSITPTMESWAFLLAEREDRALTLSLLRSRFTRIESDGNK